jgi:hypothetical protein
MSEEFVVDTTDVDDQLFNLDVSRKVDRAPKEKRPRGRPRKEKMFVQEDAPIEEIEVIEDGASAVERAKLLMQIDKLRLRLNVTGSNAKFDAHSPIEDLRAEVALMNSQVNDRRGSDVFKHAYLNFLIPTIVTVADRVVQDKSKLDLSSHFNLAKIVESNWSIFEDAFVQLGIMYGDYFNVGPVASIVQNTVICINDTNVKNQKKRLESSTPSGETS